MMVPDTMLAAILIHMDEVRGTLATLGQEADAAVAVRDFDTAEKNAKSAASLLFRLAGKLLTVAVVPIDSDVDRAVLYAKLIEKAEAASREIVEILAEGPSNDRTH